ncbi:hypothetical protein OVS_03690 [Mycoplasma ovis str. Michigan]|uniref:Uncharacterized protein n=1 Tax=Mycoplasma ovis str. Michigan TaxID=1415773 RepID=A0ABM5P251_9MOLU|nr:hypothetical protein [Mycoplasma ovis]AHC40485.1 hypothetical protein OVS_03690 [Mycoplasma ovis str. Michigan]
MLPNEVQIKKASIKLSINVITSAITDAIVLIPREIKILEVNLEACRADGSFRLWKNNKTAGKTKVKSVKTMNGMNNGSIRLILR